MRASFLWGPHYLSLTIFFNQSPHNLSQHLSVALVVVAVVVVVDVIVVVVVVVDGDVIVAIAVDAVVDVIAVVVVVDAATTS